MWRVYNSLGTLVAVVVDTADDWKSVLEYYRTMGFRIEQEEAF